VFNHKDAEEATQPKHASERFRTAEVIGAMGVACLLKDCRQWGIDKGRKELADVTMQ
jgi:hypothetical protein